MFHGVQGVLCSLNMAKRMEMFMTPESSQFFETEFSAYKETMKRKKFYKKKEKEGHHMLLHFREILCLTILEELNAEFVLATKADGLLWHRKPKMLAFVALIGLFGAALRKIVNEVSFSLSRA